MTLTVNIIWLDGLKISSAVVSKSHGKHPLGSATFNHVTWRRLFSELNNTSSYSPLANAAEVFTFSAHKLTRNDVDIAECS